MEELAAFLHDRLDEAEQIARAIIDRPHVVVATEDIRLTVVLGEGDNDSIPAAMRRLHNAMESSSVDGHRMLRDVQARRKTLARCQEEMLSGIPRLAHFAKQTLWEMAQRDVDHPGYREEWKP